METTAPTALQKKTVKKEKKKTIRETVSQEKKSAKIAEKKSLTHATFRLAPTRANCNKRQKHPKQPKPPLVLEEKRLRERPDYWQEGGVWSVKIVRSEPCCVLRELKLYPHDWGSRLPGSTEPAKPPPPKRERKQPKEKTPLSVLLQRKERV